MPQNAAGSSGWVRVGVGALLGKAWPRGLFGTLGQTKIRGWQGPWGVGSMLGWLVFPGLCWVGLGSQVRAGLAWVGDAQMGIGGWAGIWGILKRQLQDSTTHY